MRRAALKAILLATGLALGGGAGAAEQDPNTIRWVVFDLPPHFTYHHGRAPRSADELANGEIDGFMRLLLARMPGYRHEFVEATTSRFEALTRAGETLCSALHVRTPQRLQWLYFSHLYPPLASREIHVVVRRDRLEALAGGRAEGERLKLADLLQRPDWHTLLGRDRSFGPQIDKLLAGHDLPRLQVGGAPAIRILDMLRAGRIDFALEYPSVVADYLSRAGEPQNLVTLPMAEGLSTMLATVACSRNPLGLRQIEAIDEAVRRLARDPQREAWVRTWRGELLDAGELKRINAYMDERGRSGPRIE